MPYDLLIGCDGIRSVVRSAFVTGHRDFECSVSDIFNRFKSVHISLPPPLKPDGVCVLPSGLPNMNGIALPETGGKINLAFGYALNKPCDEELFSEDPKVVAQYLRTRFKAFPLPAKDLANQWVGQAWSSTGQVHANFYHSNKLQALIMGDAAHATSPSIGQGMNTALADAAALDDLLDEHGDERLLDNVLPGFSETRVKEGNALTSLAFYAYSMSAAQQMRIILAQVFRGLASKCLPSLISPEPMTEIGKGTKLSVAYNELTRMGRIQAVRRVNDNARRRHFEHTTGMVTHVEGGCLCFGGITKLASRSPGSHAVTKVKPIVARPELDSSMLGA